MNNSLMFAIAILGTIMYFVPQDKILGWKPVTYSHKLLYIFMAIPIIFLYLVYPFAIEPLFLIFGLITNQGSSVFLWAALVGWVVWMLWFFRIIPKSLATKIVGLLPTLYLWYTAIFILVK